MENQNKQWYWDPQSEIKIPGIAFDMMLRLRDSILTKPEVQWALQLDKMVPAIMQKGLEDGVISNEPIPTDQNHYSSLVRSEVTHPLLTEMFDIMYDNDENWKGAAVQHTITNQGDPVWINGYWIPQVELDLYKKLKDQGAKTFRFGYIDGRQHHLANAVSKGMTSASMNPGYILWIEYQ